MKSTRIIFALLTLSGASTAGHAQWGSLVVGGLQALPKIMSNTIDKLTMESGQCERELADFRANMEKAKLENPEAANQLGAFEGVAQAKYQACKQRAEKAENGSIIDGEVVAAAVGGAVGYQAMVGTATAAGHISAVTGSNAIALQSVGMDPRMASSGAMAGALSGAGGLTPTIAAALPGLGMPGVIPGMPVGHGTPAFPGIPGVAGPTDAFAAGILGRVLGGLFTGSKPGFDADNLLKIDDVTLATGTREQVRSSLAARGLMPQAPQPGYESLGDSYRIENNKALVPGATTVSLGYLPDGRIALSVYDVSKFSKDQLEGIAKTITEKYGKPSVQQDGGLVRASWAVESGSIFLAKDGNKTSLGWRNEERLAQLVAAIQSGQKPVPTTSR